jgi:hypothetical protein
MELILYIDGDSVTSNIKAEGETILYVIGLIILLPAYTYNWNAKTCAIVCSIIVTRGSPNYAIFCFVDRKKQSLRTSALEKW